MRGHIRLIASMVPIGLFAFIASCGGSGTNAPEVATPLRVVEITPSDNAIGVALDQIVGVRFGAEVNPATINGTTLGITLAGRQISASASLAGDTATIIPSEPFSLLSTYTVTATTGIKDTAGNGLAADNVWTFTTRDGVWGAPERIGMAPGTVESPQVAVDRYGNAIAVWSKYGGPSDPYRHLWASRYTAGGGWGTAQIIESEEFGNSYNPIVGMDSNGNAIVIWQQLFSEKRVWANRYVAGSGWETAQPIGAADNTPYFHQLAVDPSGNAIVVWVQQLPGGPVQELWTNRYEAGIGWGTPYPLSTTGMAESAAIAMDEAGNALAVWEQVDATGSDIWAIRYVGGAGWGSPQRIVINTGPYSNYPRIAVDSYGNAFLVWRQYNGSRNQVWSKQFRVGTGWGAAEAVETNNGWDAYAIDIDISRDGGALAAWSAYDGTQFKAWASIFTPGSGWGTPLSLGLDNGIFSRGAMDSNGNAIVCGVSWDVSEVKSWTIRWGKASGWGAPRLFDSSDRSLSPAPAFAVNQRGSAIVVWGHGSLESSELWAAWFE